jgi:uncharacterized membrane protein YukC
MFNDIIVLAKKEYYIKMGVALVTMLVLLLSFIVFFSKNKYMITLNFFTASVLAFFIKNQYTKYSVLCRAYAQLENNVTSQHADLKSE